VILPGAGLASRAQGLGNVPGQQKVIDYLPDQVGAVIVHRTGMIIETIPIVGYRITPS
jgi:hypothetical protein